MSDPADASERHADSLAAQIMRMPDEGHGPTSAGAGTATATSPDAAGADVVEPLLSSPGHPLDVGTRTFMEGRFGHDFSQVRVHTGADAAASADAVSARAFTHGSHITFANGEYAPDTSTGRLLLAHELTHVLQQRSGVARVDRAVHQIGDAKINIDYGDVVMHDNALDRQAQIEARYAALTGKPASAISAAVTALPDSKRRWLQYALDLLADNPLAGLDQETAAKRLVDYAPGAIHEPLGPTWREFATEAMRASGWLELGITAKLQAPSSAAQKLLDKEYNPTAVAYGGAASSTCPANRPPGSQLDEPTLRTDLEALMRTYLTGQVTAINALAVSTHAVADIGTVADVVQQEASRFFAPFIGLSHTRSFQQTWAYSGHLTPSTVPGAIPADARRAFLDNRARSNADKAGLLTKVRYDARCATDETVFADVINKLAADAAVQADLNVIMSWQTFTVSSDTGAEVTMNLQFKSGVDACEARWRAVETLCHELMHVYVSQEFSDLHKNRQIIREGFTEILGDQLYNEVRSKANAQAGYRQRFEVGLAPGACALATIPQSTRGYTAAADAAERIRAIVGDSRFRAAYFLGRTTLAGLQPKLRMTAPDDPLEHAADDMARRAVARPAVHRPRAGPVGEDLRIGRGPIARIGDRRFWVVGISADPKPASSSARYGSVT